MYYCNCTMILYSARYVSSIIKASYNLRVTKNQTWLSVPKCLNSRTFNAQPALCFQLPKAVRVLCFATEDEYSSLFHDLRSPYTSSLDVHSLSGISFASLACFDPDRMPELDSDGE